MRVYDMSRFQRVIGVDGGRITGLFNVSALSRTHEAWVTPHDVTIWDAVEHRSGRVYYSGDFTGSVKDGEAKLSKHLVASNKRADVEEVWDEVLAVLAAVVGQFWATAPAEEAPDEHL